MNVRLRGFPSHKVGHSNIKEKMENLETSPPKLITPRKDEMATLFGMGIIVKQLIFNTMLENNNKIVGNNQQTESEAKLVSNTLNPESMEDKDTLKRELEGNNMEINNLKNSTMKISLEELINELDLSATIKSLI